MISLWLKFALDIPSIGLPSVGLVVGIVSAVAVMGFSGLFPFSEKYPTVVARPPVEGPSPKPHEFPAMVQELRRTFASGKTKPYRWRIEQLTALVTMLKEHEAEFKEAIRKDLGRSDLDSMLFDVNFAMQSIDEMRQNLKSWMAPEPVPIPYLFSPGRGEIHKEALGVVLVFGCWNYPLPLTLTPAASALAAGNCVVLKLPDLTKHTSALMESLLPRYLDASAVVVVGGGVEAGKALTDIKLDHIFFTGSYKTGREIMMKAAEHLTPVTLELGGKSPAFVHRSANIPLVAMRIAWAKFVNCGQTCIAPDYVLVDSAVEEQFLDALQRTITQFYGTNPKTSPDYSRLISETHTARLHQLLDDPQVKIVFGGDVDIAERYLAPTVVRVGLSRTPRVMQDEIFGPILPVIRVDDFTAAVSFVNDGEKPLAVYVYSADKAIADHVLASTSSGTAAVNDAVYQFAISTLPFGGVGASGIGRYHGKAGFDTFSHRKSVLRRPLWFLEPLALRYPPFPDWKKKVLLAAP